MRTIKVTIDDDKNVRLLTKMLNALKFVVTIEKERNVVSQHSSLPKKEHDKFHFPISKVPVKSGYTFSRDEIYDANGR